MLRNIRVSENIKDKTEQNFWITAFYTNPEFSEAIYNIPFKELNGEISICCLFDITSNNSNKSIAFFDEKDEFVWSNLVEHNYLVGILTQYKNVKSFLCGYIQGTHSPLGSVPTSALHSANAFDGYQFWIKLYF